MRLYKSIFYKLFIKNRYLLYFILVIILCVFNTVVNLNSITIDSKETLRTYRSYISEFSGELSESKLAQIHKLEGKMNSAIEKTQELNNDFSKGNISLKEYMAKRSKLNELNNSVEAYNLFKSRFDYAQINDFEIFDSTAWDALFSFGVMESAQVFVSILLVVLLFVRDLESPILNLQKSTINGTKKIYRKYVWVFVFIPFMLGLTVSIFKLLTVNAVYGLEYGNIPMNRLELFYNSNSGLTIIEGYLLISVLKSFGLVFVCALTFLLGTLLKNSLYTVGISFFSVLIPEYLFSDNINFYRIPTPTSLIYSDGFFKSFVGTNLSSMQLESRAVILTVIFSLALCAVIFWLTYTLNIRRSDK